MMRGALFIMLASIPACAPYWIKTGGALPVASVKKVYAPCGHPMWAGCTIRTETAAYIELRQGLSEDVETCVLKHELYHAQGYDHDLRWNLHRHNCGEF